MDWVRKWWPQLVVAAVLAPPAVLFFHVAVEAHTKAIEVYSFIEEQKKCKDLCDELDRDGVLEITYEECVRRCERDREED